MQGAFEYIFPHHLPLRFGTQIPNMMCIMMVKNPKISLLKFFVPKAVKACCPCRAQGKQTFLSTSNVIISQFVRSTFLKLFAHVLLIV
jgi:hypothetical protein